MLTVLIFSTRLVMRLDSHRWRFGTIMTLSDSLSGRPCVDGGYSTNIFNCIDTSK